ncbi:hypothetical protein [Burkholderia pyrrocinia]|uniref:hypothetical protein n=1 Tax=Burkholderia pyrrocinia TaxID=60550 RepID=UPI0030D39AB6
MPLARRSTAALARMATPLLGVLLAGFVAAQTPGPAISLCSVAITASSGTTVDVSYAGLPGNQPRSYGDFVALWASSVVPWTVAPDARLDIPTNAEMGSVVLVGVSISRMPYTVAYGVGPKTGDACASALLAPDGSTGVVDAVSVELASLGVNAVTFRYHTLTGYRPATEGNWIGLWRGRASPYNAPPPLARAKVAQDVTDDSVTIDGVTLAAGNVYTAVYFMGEPLTTAAVLLTFTVPPR